ncbi:MAG: histidine phosphatase family protein [Lachnospiraceae bacterium]|nr:histidine phosphatase family protein [Lachnospiraceae bacterium]
MTVFYFVRHGEPDYGSVGEWNDIPFGKEFAGLSKSGIEQITKSAKELKKYSPEIIISSPYARALHGAAIMSRELELPVFVEKDLHEWNSDRTHSVADGEQLFRLCKEFDACNGVYPAGEEKQWESRELLRKRVLGVLEKYSTYERVIVSGHAIMMQTITEQYRPFAYGEIVEWGKKG